VITINSLIRYMGCYRKVTLEEEHEKKCIHAKAVHRGMEMIYVRGRKSIYVHGNQQEREWHVAKKYMRKMARENVCTGTQSNRRGEPMDERSRHKKQGCVTSCMQHAT
jgi:hypothetical protein